MTTAREEGPEDVVFLAALGRRIRRARRLADLTQQQLATKCGIDRTYLGAIERGVGNPSAVVLWELANALSLELAELMPVRAEVLRGGHDQPPPPPR